jgi:hypothetical protein
MPVVNTADVVALEQQWTSLHQRIPRPPATPVQATPPT